MKPPRSSRRKTQLVALLAAATLLACKEPTGPLPALLWEAEFESAAGVTGTGAMVANGGVTQISIAISGADNGTQFGWAVRSGDCSSSGERVGPAAAFPAVTISTGFGTASTILNRRLGGSSQYAIEVFPNTNGTGVALACGELIRAD